MNGDISITMDDYIEVLNYIKGDLWKAPDSVWPLFLSLVSDEYYDGSPICAMRDFCRDAEWVERVEFEGKFPKYSELMTWDEFIDNECVIGNEDAAIRRLG